MFCSAEEAKANLLSELWREDAFGTRDEDRPGTLQAFRPGCAQRTTTPKVIFVLTWETAGLARANERSVLGKAPAEQVLKLIARWARKRGLKVHLSQFTTRYMVQEGNRCAGIQ